jgi:hypothetical protein
MRFGVLSDAKNWLLLSTQPGAQPEEARHRDQHLSCLTSKPGQVTHGQKETAVGRDGEPTLGWPGASRTGRASTQLLRLSSAERSESPSSPPGALSASACCRRLSPQNQRFGAWVVTTQFFERQKWQSLADCCLDSQQRNPLSSNSAMTPRREGGGIHAGI